MVFDRQYFLNRTICEVLDEMRKCDTIKNYAPLLSLIEEAQIMANRMEAKLEDAKDLEYMYEEKKKLKKEIKELRSKRDD